MTLEEYNLLSVDSKEEFINSGGIISSITSAPSKEKNALPSLDSIEEATLPIEGAIEQQVFTVSKQKVVEEHAEISTNSNLDSSSGLGLPEEVSPEGPSSFPHEEKVNESSSVSPSEELSPLDVPSQYKSLDDDILFDIKDPVELLFLLDEDISSGKVVLHDWQMQFMFDFAMGGNSDKSPLQAIVCAANGSGKDAFVIASCVVWLCMRFKNSRGVVTSASGDQLDNQTCRHITHLTEAANRVFGQVWKINYREYTCIVKTPFGVFKQPIDCFATDEARKAEGYHPLRPGAKMGIFLSEDKTIPDEINIAINKCTGYTHRVHASTPGLPVGHFFDLYSIAVDRKEIKTVLEVSAETYIRYHITAYQCPHLTASYIKQMERDLNGKDSPAFKSQVLAEFATTDEMVVLPYTYVWKAMRNKTTKWEPEEHNKAGLDLSLGLAESVLVTRNGNKVLHIDAFRFDDPEDTILYLIEKFKERGLKHRDALIFGDCVGIGAPILYSLKRKGWSNIRFFDSRAAAINKRVYKNLIAEKWFFFAQLLKQNEIILPFDDILQKQLTTRYYKLLDGVIHQLLSKLEQRNKGYPSPDRADAVVYSFNDFKSTFVSAAESEESKPKFEEVEEEEEVAGSFDMRSWSKNQNGRWRGKYKINEGQEDFSLLQGELEQYNIQRKLQAKL